MLASYLRCSHCRGFYELALSHCRYCRKDVPVRAADGAERVFVDREMCRAIQVREYEQLPAEAHADCMRPDPELLDKLCGCLHCGPEGGLFEAVEMRWIANEGMWACPCTTCGGRGFSFDIHVVEPLWHCECGHWYSPPADDRRHSAANCPKCGSKEASGWFDDEEEDEGLSDEELAAEFGDLGDGTDRATHLVKDEELPWEDESANTNGGADGEEEDGPFAPEQWAAPEREKLPDDIDFPHERSERLQKEGENGDVLRKDDIPW